MSTPALRIAPKFVVACFVVALIAVARAPEARGQDAPLAASVDLRDPGPGRVPLVVESVGHRLSIGEALGEGRRGPYGHELCYSPCTLYVHPGLFRLLATGEGIVPKAARLIIPADGLRVRMRAPRNAYSVSMLLLVDLSAVTAFGGTVLALLGSSDGPEELGVGLVAAGVVGLIVHIAVMARTLRGGVASSEPLRPQRVSVSMGAVPIANGAALAATLRF